MTAKQLTSLYDRKEKAMSLLSNYVGSFCEIKILGMYKVMCTGKISDVGENSISLSDMVRFDVQQGRDAIITVLGQARGLQVFKALNVTVSDDGIIRFADMSKIVDTERRAAYRIIADLQALVTADDNPHIGYDAIIKDISVRGISLWVHKKFNIDDIITVQFPLDSNSDKLCVCRCSIVRTIGSTNYNMRKYGCEFVSVSDGAENAIKAFINKKRTFLMQQEFGRK